MYDQTILGKVFRVFRPTEFIHTSWNPKEEHLI